MFSSPLTTREMKINATLRFHFTLENIGQCWRECWGNATLLHCYWVGNEYENRNQHADLEN